METDFTKDAKTFQSTCDEQFPMVQSGKISRENDCKNHLIEHNSQYQPKEFVQYAKEFGFQFSDITDEEALFIDMLIDSRDVYLLQKSDVGKTRQKFHIT